MNTLLLRSPKQTKTPILGEPEKAFKYEIPGVKINSVSRYVFRHYH